MTTPRDRQAPDPEAPKAVIWLRPERSGRGPAPSLTRAEIASAAIAIADAQGIEAVSMRGLAAALGVGATSLYRYVESKDELIDLMVDAVMGEAPPLRPSGEWRADMRTFAGVVRTTMLAHPWFVVSAAGRPRLGPNTATRLEEVLVAIDGLGLSIDDMLLVVGTIDAFVRGSVIEELSDAEALRRSGLDQEQWMRSQAPYIESLLSSGDHPLLAKVIAEASSPGDPDGTDLAFTRGLERLLDGLATMIPPHP
jgi:AcrR family transcriptional regulator